MGRIRLRLGENEVELEGSDTFIKKYLDQFLSRIASTPPPGRVSLKEQLLTQASGKIPAPAEFFMKKGKKDGVSQILIFGKYLEQFRNRPEFTRKELNQVANEAKLSKDIHAQFFTNAVKQGLLRKQGDKYSLTLSAEEFLAGI
jgi:hypothetical protein